MGYQVLIVSPSADLAAGLSETLSGLNEADHIAVSVQYDAPALRKHLAEPERECIVVVDLHEVEPALQCIQQARTAGPNIVVVATGAARSGDLMLRAMRAGAVDFLIQPFETEKLRILFQRISRKRRSKQEPPRAPGRVIAFMNARGGCGASTAALHVAACVAQTKEQGVLLIDLDLHCGTLDFRLQLRPQYTLGEALEHVNELSDVWSRLRIEWKGLDLLPAPSTAGAVPPHLLQLVPALIHYATGVYTVTVTDMPAAFLAACPEIAGCLDAVFVVTTPGLASLHLARRRIYELQNAGFSGKQIGLVVNRFGSATETLPIKKIEEVMGAPVFAKLNNDSGTVQAAMLAAGLVPANSVLGRQYNQLGRQILGLKEEQEGRGRGFLSRLLPQSA